MQGVDSMLLIHVHKKQTVFNDSTNIQTMFLTCTCTVRVPVFGRNQNMAPPSITEKPVEVYYLDEWIIITLYVAGLLRTSNNILILPSQFWQIRFEKLLIALFKVPNTGAFTVYLEINLQQLRASLSPWVLGVVTGWTVSVGIGWLVADLSYQPPLFGYLQGENKFNPFKFLY